MQANLPLDGSGTANAEIEILFSGSCSTLLLPPVETTSLRMLGAVVTFGIVIEEVVVAFAVDVELIESFVATD